MAVTVGPDGGGGGGTTTTTPPPPAPKPAPTVYWFRGKAYYSLEAYNAAVEAYQILLMKQQAAQRAAAAAAAQQQQLITAQQTAAAELREQQLLRQRNMEQYRQAALLAARDRALQLAAQEAAERQEQQLMLQAKAEAARKLAMARAAESERRRQILMADARAALAEAEALRRRRAEAAAERARRIAYDKMQRDAIRYRNQLNLQESRGGYEQARAEASLASEYEARRGEGLFGEDVPGTWWKSRNALITDANRTGDYTNLINLLDRQSRETGGRFVDEALLNWVHEHYVAPIIQIGNEYQAAVERAEALFDADRIDELIKLIESEEFLALEKKFLELFGDGRTPGSFADPARRLAEISDRRTRLWVAQMLGATTTASERDVQALYDQALKEANFGGSTAMGGHMAGDEAGRQMSAWVDAPVYDPDTGAPTGATERKQVFGLDAWIAEQERVQRLQIEAMRKQQDWMIRQSRNEGFVNARFENGEFLYDDPAHLQLVNQLFGDAGNNGWMPPKWSLAKDGSGVPLIIQQAQRSGNPILVQNLLRQFMIDASQAYDVRQSGLRDHYHSFHGDYLGKQIWVRTRNHWLEQVAKAMGYDWNPWSALVLTPPGQLLEALALPGASVISTIRTLAYLLGNEQRPYLGFNAPEDGDGLGLLKVPIGMFGLHLYLGSRLDPNADKSREEFLKAFGTGDIGLTADAIRQYGMGWAEGNVGWLLEGAADPTLGLPLFPGSRAARIVAATRGLDWARPGLRGAAYDFYRLAGARTSSARFRLPGTLTGDFVNTQWAKMQFIRQYGGNLSTLEKMTDEMWEEALALAKKKELENSRWFRILAAVNNRYNKTQLLRMLEQELPDFARAAGIGVTDPFKMMARIREVRRRYQEALHFAEEAGRIEAAQAKRAAALVAARRAGVAVPRSVAVTYAVRRAARTGGNVRRIARQAIEEERQLVRSFQREAKDYLGAAKRAQAAADALEAGIASGDVRRLATLRAQFNQAWMETSKYTDKYGFDLTKGDFVVRNKNGLVGEQMRRVYNHRNRIGGDPTAPRMDKVTMQEIRGDRIRIERRIRRLRSQLKAAAPAPRAQLEAQIQDLEAALRGLEYETILLQKGRSTYRQLARREKTRIGKLISVNKVAHVAETPADQAREVARDFYSFLQGTGHASAERFGTQISRQFDDARTILAKPVDWSDPRLAALKTRLQKVMDFADANDLTLEEAYVLLQALLFQPGGRLAWGQTFRVIQAQVFDAMRQAGVTGLGTAGGRAARQRDFITYIKEAHLRSGKPALSMSGLEPLDQMIANSFHDFGIGTRKGQFRPGPRRYSDPDTAYRLTTGDRDPDQLLIKMRALKDHGLSMWEYDDLRAVLSPSMVKKNTTASLLADAKKAAAASGNSVEDELKRLREVRRDLESQDRFVEFASRLENQEMSPEMLVRHFEETMISSDLLTVPDRVITDFQREALERSFVESAGFASSSVDEVAELLQKGGAGAVPMPKGDYQALREWLVDHGYWSPRTGDTIAEGARVWSLGDERQFFEQRFAWTPPWTRPEVMAPLLDDQRLLNLAFRGWNFFANSFESTVAGLDLSVKKTQQGLAYGVKDAAGNVLLKRQRTAEEMRQWMIQRYGDLVAGPNGDLIRAPWLMRAGDEYEKWWDRVVSEAGQQAHSADLLAVRSQLPTDLADELFDGNTLSRAGANLTEGLVTAAESRAFAEAAKVSMQRRLERMRKAAPHDPDPALWLAQERLLFAYDMMSELMRNRAWQRKFTKLELGSVGLMAWATFWRLLISFTPAFPIMNLLDSFGLKRFLLSVFENNGQFIGRDADGFDILGENPARAAGLSSSSVFGLEDESAFARFGDSMLPVVPRLTAAIQGVAELPLTISKFGEDRLRNDWMWTVAGNTYRAAKNTGMTDRAAAVLAKAEAARTTRRFFATIGDNPFMQILNMLIPFFSYNFNNKLIALKLVVNHPSIWVWGERIRSAIERGNREAWEREHPGVPFPEGPSASWLWIPAGDGTFYQIDLANFSDWSRGMASIANNETAVDWFDDFIRAPHPTQEGFMALLTGGMTPWGKPGSLRELSMWVDLLWWLQGNDYKRQEWQRDAVQIFSQILFFKKFGAITPLVIERQTFFGLMELDREAAFEYLDAHPDLALYFEMRPDKNARWFNPTTRTSWRDTMTKDEQDEYDSAFQQWEDLNNRLDQNILKYANEPWSPEYRQAKREAFLVRTMFLKNNPILTEAWGMFMSPGEFAAFWEDFKLDQMVDAWFNWARPKRSDYASDLEYQRALVAYYQRREDYLDANPALFDRLYQGQSVIERAWHEQELHWADILEFQAKLKVRILEEEATAEPNRDLIEVLYRVRDIAQQELNAESYEVLFGEIDNGTMSEEWNKRTSFTSTAERLGLGGLVRRVAEIPGFGDFLYERASPEEREAIQRDERYAKGIAAIVRQAKSGADFYNLLFQDPWLLAEYWRRNPARKVAFDAGREYFRWISAWVAKLKANNFDGAEALWNQMPAWVRARYLAKHPESGMADGMGGADDFGGGSGAGSAGQQYFAAISRWVQLLKAKDFVEADAYFRALPDWMKERYYKNHPDQRAKNDLDSAALRAGAEYFLAAGDDKLKVLLANPALRQWLLEHGGDEAAMRGLILAIYRAIPSNEAWLKRTFRERFPEIFSVEAQGQRRLRSVARRLAENPELLPFYEKALVLQSKLFTEQLKLNKVPPKPVSMERRRRMAKRRRRRTSRFHSAWTMHRDLRLGR